MIMSEPHRTNASTTVQEPAVAAPVLPASPSPSVIRRPSPVLQTLLIVGILLVGLMAGVFILRSEKKMPSGDAREEKAGGEKEAKLGEKAKGGHEHDEKDAHGAKGRVELTAEKLANANLGTETVGPASVHITLSVFGKIVPDEERLAHISPRFAGIVKKVNKHLGETVNSGDVLATVESNESLQSYDIKAPLAGTIIERSVSVGEFVGTDKSLFTVADLNTIWVDFQIYQQDFPKLKVGQSVRISSGHRAVHDAPTGTAPLLTQERPETTIPATGNREQAAESAESAPEETSGTIAYLSPFGAENTQTMLARADVPNRAGRLRPGLFVTGEVAVNEVKAPVAVREAAVQSLDGREVVFIQEGDDFEARPVEVGRRDNEWAEIRSGVNAGERYVAVHSFILKAELGKEGAEHED